MTKRPLITGASSTTQSGDPLEKALAVARTVPFALRGLCPLTLNRRDVIETSGVLVAGLTAGCSEIIPSQPDPTPVPESDQWTPKPSVEGSIARDSDQDLIVRDHSFAIAGDDARIRGSVRNTDDSPQPVTITVALFRDGDGLPLAEREAEREGLAAGNQWRFAVVFSNVNASEITRYTIESD